VFYETKNVISLVNPGILLEGTTVGDRTFNINGKMFGWDMKNNLFCEV
jgi:hypothetical protein